MKTGRGRSRLVSDYDSNSIHVVTSEGTVRTLCDNGQEGFEDGQGTVSHLVSDYGSNSIRVVTSEGTVHTMCGNGQEGFEEGQGTVVFNCPASSTVMYNFGVGPRFAYVSASARAPK